MSNEHNSRKSFGPYVLDVNDDSCLRGDENLELDPQEFKLLMTFIERRGQWLTKPHLFSAIWPDENDKEIELDNRLQHTLSVLRKKLGSPGRDFIETKRKKGYRFTAEVKDLGTLTDEDCPWVGLRFIGEQQAKYFYGRQNDLTQMIEKLSQGNFLAVTSRSGIGKSSLVRAGLIPTLKRYASDHGESLTCLVFTPKQAPLRQLAEQLLILNGTPFSEDELESQILILSSTATELERRVNDATGRVLLVIDQFEELTLCEDKGEQDSFVANLMTAVTGIKEKLFVVLTLRSDFAWKFEAYPILWSHLSQHQYGITKLTREQLREVIERPAQLVRLQIDDGVADQILNDLGDEPTALPLLSHTMVELFKHREGMRLTLQGYQATGGVGRAIGNHADSVFDKFDPQDKDQMRNLMIELTRVGDRPQHDVRNPKPFKELIGQGVDALERERILRVLLDERLLFKGDPPDESVEICHETLIQHWRKLRRWLDDGRDALRRFERLNLDAHDWEESNLDNKLAREPALLYTGPRLKEAEKVCQGFDKLVKPIHWDFIEFSKAVENRLRMRRRRLQMIGIGASVLVFFVISLIVGVVLGEIRKRKETESHRLASDAISQLRNDPELSLLLAIEAGKLGSTSEVDVALRRALFSLDQRATFIGHQRQVLSVNVSSDGRFLLTGGADYDARMWDIKTAKTVQRFQGHRDWVNSAMFSRDGSRVVTASRDGEVRIWDVISGQVLKVITGHEKSVQSATFSSDGKRVLTAGEDGTIRLWDAMTGKPLIGPLEGHSKTVNSAIFSPDETLIASASVDRTVGIWDAKTGKRVKTLSGHSGTVIGVAFDPKGHRLVTASSDKTATIWDLETAKRLVDLRGHTGPVYTAEFDRDGKWVLTASNDGTVRIWDAESGLELKTFYGHWSAVNAAVFSPVGNSAFSVSGDGTARMWDIQFRQQTRSLSGHADSVVKLTFSPDGKFIATASHDKTVRLWTTATLQQIKVFQHADSVEGLAFSAQGDLIATAGHDGKARMWSVSSNDDPQEFVRQEVPVEHAALTSIAFSGNSMKMVTGAVDGTIQVWDRKSGALLKSWQAHKGVNRMTSTLSVVFSPDDRFLATSGADNVVRLWSTSNWEKEAEWDLGTGQINSVVFSPNGGFLVGACQDQTIRVWNMSDKQTLAVLRGHDKPVVSVNFSPNGALLLTASADKTARLWEIGANALLATFEWNNSLLTGAYFSPDGRTIAITDVTGSVKLYSCEICAAQTSDLLGIAQNRRTREMTLFERQRFLNKN